MPLAQADKDDLETAEALAPLLKVRGWHIYLAILDNHIAQERQKIELPSDSVDALVALESRKGALIGLRLARHVVSNIMAHADEIRKRLGPNEEI